MWCGRRRRTNVKVVSSPAASLLVMPEESGRFSLGVMRSSRPRDAAVPRRPRWARIATVMARVRRVDPGIDRIRHAIVARRQAIAASCRACAACCHVCWAKLRTRCACAKIFSLLCHVFERSAIVCLLCRARQGTGPRLWMRIGELLPIAAFAEGMPGASPTEQKHRTYYLR